MRIKICGITQTEQAVAIAKMGASVLGFICVRQSPRYVTPDTISTISQVLPPIDRFGVFANAPLDQVLQTATKSQLSGIQLHGQESPAYCQQLRSALPHLELIKALRIRNSPDLDQVQTYNSFVDTFLLDAYHPHQLGGTGQTLDWDTLQAFRPEKPWFLAGGLRPANITQALTSLSPDGIDLSSGVEESPGIKDLTKVRQLIETVRALTPQNQASHL